MTTLKLAAEPASAQNQALNKSLHKLGLLRDIDLALHLPLRYEDETRVTRLSAARDGDVVQIEATVTASAAMNITAPTARPETRCGCCCIDLILGARDAMW